MKKIKFKAKRIDNKEWVYGFFTGTNPVLDRKSYINAINETYEVITQTIGQFTGLHDRDGKEIYEADVLLEADTQDKYRVYYDNSLAQYRIENITDECDDRALNSIHQPQIIGNIHDNKELIIL